MQNAQNIFERNFFHKNFLLFIIFTFTIVFILIELKNGRYWQSDFEVYYRAASRMLNSENLYRMMEDRFYRYKYSPAAAFLYTPFTLLPFELAKFSYTFFLSFLIYLIIKISYKMSKIDKNYFQTNKNKLIAYCLLLYYVWNCEQLYQRITSWTGKYNNFIFFFIIII